MLQFSLPITDGDGGHNIQLKYFLDHCYDDDGTYESLNVDIHTFLKKC